MLNLLGEAGQGEGRSLRILGRKLSLGEPADYAPVEHCCLSNASKKVDVDAR